MVEIGEYLEYVENKHPEIIITTELTTLLAWFLANKPSVSIKDAVNRSEQLLKKIQPYINNAKFCKLKGQFDVTMMGIYSCLYNHYKLKEILPALELSEIVRRTFDASGSRIDEIDESILFIYCHLALKQPNLEPEEAVNIAESIFTKIDKYLCAARTTRVNRNTFDVIELYLWVADKYPHLELDEAVRWVARISVSNIYRKVNKIFPPTFPFSCIEWTSFTHGQAELRVWPKTHFTAPLLDCLLQYPSLKKDTHNGVAVYFDLEKKTDTYASVIESVNDFLQLIEDNLVSGDPAYLFRLAKNDLLSAAHEFCKADACGYPGLKHLQFHPPLPLDETSKINNPTSEAILTLNFDELKKILTAGFDPNHAGLRTSMEVVSSITVDCTEPKAAQLRAAKILSIATLLIEYGADPGIKKDPNHPGSTTLLESLINRIYLEEVHPVEIYLITELVKLTLRSDGGRSHLAVSTAFENNFLGKLLILGQRALYEEGSIPLQLGSFELDCGGTPTIKITNTQGKLLFWTMMPLSMLRTHPKHIRDLIELCKRTFPWKGQMTEQEFIDHIDKMLTPKNQVSVIDLVIDGRRNIVAFNITDIAIPSFMEKRFLHYVRLASCDQMVSKAFPKLMSLISFQRLIFLKDYYKAEILTAFAAASAVSYLLALSSGLKIYPKYNCTSEKELKNFQAKFFSDKELIREEGVCYLPSKLFYHLNVNKNKFLTKMDANALAYNQRLEKEGHSVLVTLNSSSDNINSLADKIRPSLRGGLTLFDVMKKLQPLNEFSLQQQFQSKL